MREVLWSDGKTKAITMDTEPKRSKRPGPEPITTHNTPVKTRAEREAARAAVKAETERIAAMAKAKAIEAEKGIK
jgi:hypothetical protein